MGTLVWLRPIAAPAVPAGPSAAHVVAGGSVKGRPRRVSVASRCTNPRVLQAGRCRWLVVRSGVTAAAAAADDPEDSSGLSDLQVASRIRGVFFYTVTAVAAIFLFIAMVVVHPLVLLFDRHRRRAQHYIAKIWATLAVSMFYKLEVEGMENLPPNSSPAVYVANHQSFLDIYTLLTLGRCFKFISKTSIFMLPVIGWAMYLLGVIPLRRMDSRSQLDCLKRCVDLVKRGASVFFFPEGTRSKDGKLGIFKRGAFSVAVKTGVPVIPITLLGTGKLMPPGMESNLNSGAVKVIIHRPIEGNDAEKLCSDARNVIADTLLLHGYGVH